LENQNIDKVILAFLQGKATPNEIEILRKWMNDDKAHQDIFASIKLYWEDSIPGVKFSHTDKAYIKLMANSSKGSFNESIDINAGNKIRKFSWLKVAAAFVIFFTFAGGVYYFINSNQPVTTEILLTTEIIKQNPKGQKLTTYLPDGSKVILNSLSKIKYSTPFIGKIRIVELEGEAFFEVTRDPIKPFEVISNGVTTTAIGTSFNVKYNSNDLVEVALISGKVKVTNSSMKSVILNPGKSATVSQNGKMHVQDFDYMEKAGWKDGILVFKNNSLPEIITKLEDWYGVEFSVDDKLLGRFHYTGNYENESLEEVLQGISFVHQFEYKIYGDAVKLYFNQKTQLPMQ